MKTTMEEAIYKCKESGIRITPQRIAIIEFLSGTTSHPNAEEIYSKLERGFPKLSLYNNLHFLVDKGMIKELSLNGSSRFDYNTSDHYHLICQSCEKIEDLNYPLFYELEDFANDCYGYKINSHNVEVFGICERCQEEKDT